MLSVTSIEVAQAISDFVEAHWLKAIVSCAFLLTGVFWGKWRAYWQWIRKEYTGRLNISLNIIDEGKCKPYVPINGPRNLEAPVFRLKIRTLLEKNLLEVFINKVAAHKVESAAHHTEGSKHCPLLPLNDDDRWHLLNAVLNELSEQFNTGCVKQAVGDEYTSYLFLVCLTYEVAGDVRTRKVRAMVIRHDQLLSLPDEIELESPHHQTRVDTLRKMAEVYKEDPSYFVEVEICV